MKKRVLIKLFDQLDPYPLFFGIIMFFFCFPDY